MALYNFKIKEPGKEWDDIKSTDLDAADWSEAFSIAVDMANNNRAEVRYNRHKSYQGYYVAPRPETSQTPSSGEKE